MRSSNSSSVVSPKVSVVITCYNYAKYLKESIDSVLGQTFRDFEVIVINDGSTDNNDEVIGPYLDKERVVYIKQDNKGQACAKNNGIWNAKGKYIAFLDADDYWEPEKLEKQVPILDSDPCIGVVYCAAKFMDDEGNLTLLDKRLKYLQPKRGWVTKYLLFDNFVPFSSSIVRREVFDKVGLFDESLRMSIDWDLWLRSSVHFKFEYVDEPLMVYRVGHPGQMSKNSDMRKYFSNIVYKRFVENNPQYINMMLRRQIEQYNLTNSGFFYQTRNNLWASSVLFLKAFFSWPLSAEPVRGILINLLLLLLGTTLKDLRSYMEIIKGDMHRYNPGNRNPLKDGFRIYGFRYTFLIRTAKYLKTTHGMLGKVLFILIYVLLRRHALICGIEIPYDTEIGKGLYIGHYGGIVVHPDVKIGRNCNINHGVTIGATYRGINPGTPVIGDCVYIGPGAKIIGGINIGNNVAIGANCVVTQSVPDNAVVVGVPGRIISYEGSGIYIANKVS